MLEKDIVVAILRYLKKSPRSFAWKTHGGMYGTAGIPDIIACMGGRFVALEVKQPGGKPTRLQEITLGKIREAGGIAAVVTSVEEVRSVLDEQKEQLHNLNRRIDERLAQAAQLRRAGRFEEWAEMEQTITREIDRFVDMQRAFGCPEQEVEE